MRQANHRSIRCTAFLHIGLCVRAFLLSSIPINLVRDGALVGAVGPYVPVHQNILVRISMHVCITVTACLFVHTSIPWYDSGAFSIHSVYRTSVIDRRDQDQRNGGLRGMIGFFCPLVFLAHPLTNIRITFWAPQRHTTPKFRVRLSQLPACPF